MIRYQQIHLSVDVLATKFYSFSGIFTPLKRPISEELMQLMLPCVDKYTPYHHVLTLFGSSQKATQGNIDCSYDIQLISLTFYAVGKGFGKFIMQKVSGQLAWQVLLIIPDNLSGIPDF